MDIVYYHGLCSDGFCAAYIASKRYPEAKLIPLNHGLSLLQIDEIITESQGKDVLMVDYSLPTRKFNDELNERAKSFRILDHHKSAQEVLEGAPYAIFDMKRSGAGLAWDYLFGKDSGHGYFHAGKTLAQYRRPWYVDYVEDRDLWNWKLPQSREICAYLGTLEFTKESWEMLDNMGLKDAIEQGAGALSHINHYVREAVKQAQTGTLYTLGLKDEGVIQSYKTAVLNVPYLNCSEIGNELAKTHDVSLTWFERGDGVYQFSLRGNGRVDVSEIAKQFGGGGHHSAAGFQLNFVEGRKLVDCILQR